MPDKPRPVRFPAYIGEAGTTCNNSFLIKVSTFPVCIGKAGTAASVSGSPAYGKAGTIMSGYT